MNTPLYQSCVCSHVAPRLFCAVSLSVIFRRRALELKRIAIVKKFDSACFSIRKKVAEQVPHQDLPAWKRTNLILEVGNVQKGCSMRSTSFGVKIHKALAPLS